MTTLDNYITEREGKSVLDLDRLIPAIESEEVDRQALFDEFGFWDYDCDNDDDFKGGWGKIPERKPDVHNACLAARAGYVPCKDNKATFYVRSDGDSQLVRDCAEWMEKNAAIAKNDHVSEDLFRTKEEFERYIVTNERLLNKRGKPLTYSKMRSSAIMNLGYNSIMHEVTIDTDEGDPCINFCFTDTTCNQDEDTSWFPASERGNTYLAPPDALSYFKAAKYFKDKGYDVYLNSMATKGVLKH